ncbi:MAG TPA: leishmanolysin-related zinc metalloendopeptidase [Polyangiaceae bacterium]|nr:leishmanolysin-related zinc metalloendopeptidase [Polyangiaceae bacterium]
MSKETFIARAADSAAAIKGKAKYTIKVRFAGGLNERQKQAFKSAASRWTQVIIGDLPPVTVDGEHIDDVLIVAEGAAIDGVGQILGQAGPTHLRPASAVRGAFLPARGEMTFDSADLQSMEEDGTLDDVIAHEMGHVLGIGTIWTHKRLLKGIGSSNPTFVGELAMKEYAALRGLESPTAVPVESTGGAGTRDAHWRETVFRNELMSGFIAAKGNPISRVTVASLQDLGYLVNMQAAEAFALPNLLALAELGLLSAHAATTHSHGTVLPIIPTVLPDEGEG